MLCGALIPAAKYYIYSLLLRKKGMQMFGLFVFSDCKILIRTAKIAALYQLVACEARFLLGLCGFFVSGMKDWNDNNLGNLSFYGTSGTVRSGT